MRGFRADLLHAFRVYRQTPGASLMAVAVLAASLAAVTAFLALWSDLALRPRPGFERAGELVTVVQTDGQRAVALSYDLIEAIDEESATLDALAGVFPTQQYVDRDGERTPVGTELVTKRYFQEVRPRIQLGRPFDEADHDPNGAPVAIISDAYWREHFGRREDVLGQIIRVYGPNMTLRSESGEARAGERMQDYRIVGVLAPEITGTFYVGTGIWMPYEQAAEFLLGAAGNYRRLAMLRGIGRRASGASDAAIRTELRGRYGEAQDLGLLAGMRFDAMGGIVTDFERQRELLRQVRLFLAGSVLLALVAACNVSLFLLARAPGRRRELAIRMAVGAPLKRLARQLATESTLLVAVAAVLGVAISLWLTTFVRELSFLQSPLWRNVTVFDWRVLGMIAALLLVLAVLVSLAPVVGLKRLGIAEGSRSVTARAGIAQRLAGTVQVAVAGVIGGAAIAFVWYLVEISTFDPNFSAPDVYVVMVGPPQGPLNNNEDALLQLREHRRETIAAIPGVENVAFGISVPGQYRPLLTMRIAAPEDPEDQLNLSMQPADYAFFNLLGFEFVAGRAYGAEDRTSIVVNEALARRLWNRTDVLGEVLPLANVPPGVNAPRWEIVGVIRDVAYGHPSDEPEPVAYQQVSFVAAFEWILVEMRRSAAELQRELQRKIDDGDLDFTINQIRRVEELWSEGISPDRARAALTVGAAVLVVALAAFGFYGTQRYLVAAGRREYAILGALGAGPRALGRLVLRRGLALGLPGLVLGTLLAFIAVAWLRDGYVSRGVSPTAVAALVAVGIALLVFAATLGPARHARNTEPAPLLREE
ncbi:MAG TPA: ABC transporter permease [Gammaproteobacteria bacterium]